MTTIHDLTPDPKNARRRTERSSKLIRQSLEKFGGMRSIVVDEDLVVRAGNGTIKEAAEVGIERVKIVDVDGDEIIAVRRSGLTEQEWAQYAVADNRTSDLSEWDVEVLAETHAEVGLGDWFTVDEIADWDDPVYPQVTEEEDEESTSELLDQVEKDAIESRVKPGEIWALGRHRIACGDSTDEANVRKLLGDRFGDVGMVWADPPYNIDYSGVNDKRKIANDKMPDDKFVQFLSKAIFPAPIIYLCCSWQYAHLFRQSLINIDRHPKAMIVWDKVNPAQHLDKYFKQHEIIFYHGSFGGQATLRGDVWQVPRQRNTIHPTMKPVELVEIAFGDSPSDLIFDPFLGSAPSIIAAQKMEGDRTVYGFELSPDYCEVICQRFEKFTGQNAELVGHL